MSKTKIMVSSDCKISTDGINVIEYKKGQEIDATPDIMEVLGEEGYELSDVDLDDDIDLD